MTEAVGPNAWPPPRLARAETGEYRQISPISEHPHLPLIGSSARRVMSARRFGLTTEWRIPLVVATEVVEPLACGGYRVDVTGSCVEFGGADRVLGAK